MIAAALGELAYRLWDLKDGSQRVQQYHVLMRSQFAPPAELARLQIERADAMCAYAYAHCDYYRKRWNGAPRIRSLDDLRQLPLVRKADVRAEGAALITDAIPAAQLVEARTGGSTGRALQLYFDVRCQEYRNAAAMRSDSWAGWHPGMQVAGLWGSPYLPKNFRQRLRNWLHDRTFYLDTMNLTAQTMGDFAVELERRRPGGLFGHAHSLFVFARFVEEQKLAVPQFKAIIATSMMLLASERKVIERVFRCKVTNRYGCEEVGLIASECERHSGLHVNSEHVIVEILRPDGAPAAPGEDGEIVVTDLNNRGMPLIRYAIEDVASWSSSGCACGRHMPMLERLVGRLADFLVRPDGGFVAGVSLVEKTLTAIDGLDQLQIVQTSMDSFRLHVVPSALFDEGAERALLAVMHDVFGAAARVEIQKMTQIPQEKNGKYRFAICQVERASG